MIHKPRHPHKQKCHDMKGHDFLKKRALLPAAMGPRPTQTGASYRGEKSHPAPATAETMSTESLTGREARACGNLLREFLTFAEKRGSKGMEECLMPHALSSPRRPWRPSPPLGCGKGKAADHGQQSSVGPPSIALHVRKGQKTRRPSGFSHHNH